jgi:urease accessory protein
VEEALELARGGSGALRIERVGDRSVVHTARANSPLKLLLPGNHGDAAWTFVTNFGGGLVDGDAIDLRIEVGPGARALLGTQASTKVYRSPNGCRQSFTARVEANGLLAMLADPIVCFADARYAQTIDVTLETDATLVLVDCLVSGRIACNERWAFARYSSRIRVTRAERLVLHDALHLHPDDGDLPTRMGRFDALATVVAIGPLAHPVRERVLASSLRPERKASRVHTAAALGDDGAIGRIAASTTAEALGAVHALLEPLAELLGDDPFARKW